MKITDIKLIPVNKFLFVKVYTDEVAANPATGAFWSPPER